MNDRISSSEWASCGRNVTRFCLDGVLAPYRVTKLLCGWYSFKHREEKDNVSEFIVQEFLVWERQCDGTDEACMRGANWGWGGGEKNPPPFPPHIPPFPSEPSSLWKPATQASTDVQGTTPELAMSISLVSEATNSQAIISFHTWSSAADLSCFSVVSRRSFSIRWLRSVMEAIAVSLQDKTREKNSILPHNSHFSR